MHAWVWGPRRGRVNGIHIRPWTHSHLPNSRRAFRAAEPLYSVVEVLLRDYLTALFCNAPIHSHARDSVPVLFHSVFLTGTWIYSTIVAERIGL